MSSLLGDGGAKVAPNEEYLARLATLDFSEREIAQIRADGWHYCVKCKLTFPRTAWVHTCTK